MNLLSMSRYSAVLLFCIVIVSVPYRAFAHAVLVDSSPRPNAVINGPNAIIVLRYNSRVDAARSSLILVLPNGNRENLHPDGSSAGQAAPNVVQTRVAHLVKGGYTLRWQVLATDGHITRGAIAFSVR